ncbi:hypothetical protein [Magnetovibrio sp.]|uniref:hypothetical protein n=1 Tax=Magnetovibrio sp. TaxID=2024836 RepID=UPI002F9599EF
MIFNNVDIKVITDFTAYTDTVCFQVAVPVAKADATKIYEDLAAGDWQTTEGDITAAVNKSAPKQIQTLVTALLAAYNGTTTAQAAKVEEKKDDANVDNTQ